MSKQAELFLTSVNDPGFTNTEIGDFNITVGNSSQTIFIGADQSRTRAITSNAECAYKWSYFQHWKGSK